MSALDVVAGSSFKGDLVVEWNGGTTNSGVNDLLTLATMMHFSPLPHLHSHANFVYNTSKL